MSERFKHNESGRIVIWCYGGHMKNEAGEWVRSVTYCTEDNNEVWTRSEASFYEAFTKI